MKKPGKRLIWLITVTAALVLAAALLICFTAGIFPGRPPRETAKDPQQRTSNGIRFEQSDELRGRMIRVMARREAETTLPEGEEALRIQKLFDGALLCFAEAASQLWPELDSASLTACLLFNDEAEKGQFMELAARLIGVRTIDKPEDITYWINKETLAELMQQEEKKLSERN